MTAAKPASSRRGSHTGAGEEMATSIPRFLLPQRGLIWRRVVIAGSPSAASNPSSPASVVVRFNSNKSSSGPRILEKPARFNPPSHGSRLPRKGGIPRHYGGELSDQDLKYQETREYPMMPPPKNTWAHWFLNARWVHLVITLGSLTSLAVWTFAVNFKETSPFADMLPPVEDYLWHPISSVRMLIEVMRLHEAHKSARIQEKRKRGVDDVAKRAAYRKAHGLPEEMGLFNTKRATIRSDDEEEKAVDDASPVAQEREKAQQRKSRHEPAEVRRLTEEEQKEIIEGVKKKWLGIF
ncbi:hypothetical protein QBC38DRAFT_508956 [Podospora fimiseda]|uniref:Uncharacterized protein n=1 Tax=Podospora fimiseda TaxID=252190 RepID=A0AAN7BSZ6_9PEZI|nr:hypothetical protein QBC38DRAFT_508956 [Podospora fimiseda]